MVKFVIVVFLLTETSFAFYDMGYFPEEMQAAAQSSLTTPRMTLNALRTEHIWLRGWDRISNILKQIFFREIIAISLKVPSAINPSLFW